MKIYNYTVIFESLDEGGYDVIVPAIPEICTFGQPLSEAGEMAEDAIKCYLESALERNELTPAGRNDIMTGGGEYGESYKYRTPRGDN